MYAFIVVTFQYVLWIIPPSWIHVYIIS